MHKLLNRFVVLVLNLVTPHSVHGLTRFKGQPRHLLTRQSGSILARKVTLKYLNVLAGIGRLMMIVTDKT